MKNKILMLVPLFLMPGALMAQHPAASQAPHASVTSLVSKDLRELPGKEGLMITVGYPPGAVDPIHRNASSTKPAKFIVFFVKDKGAPVLVPAPE